MGCSGGEAGVERRDSAAALEAVVTIVGDVEVVAADGERSVLPSGLRGCGARCGVCDREVDGGVLPMSDPGSTACSWSAPPPSRVPRADPAASLPSIVGRVIVVDSQC